MRIDKFYRLEIGTRHKEEDFEEHNLYIVKRWENTYCYYDENVIIGIDNFDNLMKYAKDCVKSGVNNTYAVIEEVTPSYDIERTQDEIIAINLYGNDDELFEELHYTKLVFDLWKNKDGEIENIGLKKVEKRNVNYE